MKVAIDEWIEKKSNFCSMGWVDQVKYMAYFFVKLYKDQVFTAANVDGLFELADLVVPINTADKLFQLARKNLLVKKDKGYSFHRDEFKKLELEFSQSKPKIQTAKSLRDLLLKIRNPDENSFLKEAITCFETREAYRATIIMTWILTLDHLFDYILKNKLIEFNSVLAKQPGLKIKNIVSKDNFTEMKEEKFIEICRAAGIISKDVKKILDEKLGIRNSCAHPNSVIVKESKATDFVDDLIENVVLKF